MKFKKIKLLVSLSILLFCNCNYAQNEPYFFVYNTINYFAPADSHSDAVNKTSYDKTEIKIDFTTNKIILKTYFSDGPVESIYTIKQTSELQSDSVKGNYYTFICLASNYAEAIFEVSKEGKWIIRTIKHNGITHKYYNR